MGQSPAAGREQEQRFLVEQSDGMAFARREQIGGLGELDVAQFERELYPQDDPDDHPDSGGDPEGRRDRAETRVADQVG